MEVWRETTLGAICAEVDGEIQTGPFGSQLHESDYSEEGVPVVMPKDIREGLITTDSIARVEVHHAERLSRYVLREGDIVFGRRGDIGRQALARKEQDGWLCGTGCLLVRLGHSIVDPLWLHFFLKQDEVIGWLAGQAIGATLPNLNTSILHGVPIRLPDLPTQRRIAGILSAYDELIANNQRRIAVLEQMARALYREWFVYFRAPGVVMGSGELPEGWEVKELAQLCSRMESGGTPLRSNSEFWEEGSIPWYKTKELWDSYLFEAEEAITPLAIQRTSAKVFQPGTILMAIYGSPTVGRMGIVTKESSCNQAALGMVANEKLITQTFLYFALLNERERFNRMAQGAAQQNISKEIVARTEVVVPPRDLIEQFDKVARPLFDLNRTIQEQTANLRRTRDLLLPRLMSGRVEVNTIEA